MVFSSAADATAFARYFTGWVTRAQSSMVMQLLGFAQLLKQITVTPTDAILRAEATFSARDVIRLITMAASFIPQIRVPGMAPRGPQREDQDEAFWQDVRGKWPVPQQGAPRETP